MISKRRLLLMLFLIVLAVGGTALDVFVLYPQRPHSGTGASRVVTVPRGIGPKGLARLLQREGLIASPGRFALWLRVTGAVARVRAGEFALDDRLSPAEIIHALSGRGIGKGIKVVFPEGSTLSDMGMQLEAAGVVKARDFVATAIDPALVTSLGAPGPTMEGYLFPDTYYFEASDTAETIVRRLHQTFRERLDDMGIAFDAGLKSIVTLASIVQAETPIEAEMPLVAGVYTNRLTRPDYPSRRLQADPTVSYGCQPFINPQPTSCATFKGTLGRRQLDDSDNPYNTYQHPGLPPGPISAPGVAALKAAAHPKPVPYLFFVASAKGDGSHVFSENLEAHQEAVEAYRNR